MIIARMYCYAEHIEDWHVAFSMRENKLVSSAKSTIGAALGRSKNTSPSLISYEECVKWSVPPDHAAYCYTPLCKSTHIDSNCQYTSARLVGFAGMHAEVRERYSRGMYIVRSDI